MKTRLFPFIFAMLSVAFPFPLSASLGGDAKSVQADQLKMQGTLRTIGADSYSVREIQTPTGLAVKEYVSPAGTVFAVTWKGPFQPDLRQLLGSSFDSYVQAVQAQRAQRRSRGPLLIQQPGLVVQMAGHMRSFLGKAYLPQMLPAGFRVEALR